MMPQIRHRLIDHRWLLTALGMSLAGWVVAESVENTRPRSEWTARIINAQDIPGPGPGGDISPDGRFITAWAKAGLTLFDATSGRVLTLSGKRLSSGDLTGAADLDLGWMGGGRYLVARLDRSDGERRDVYQLGVWDLSTGEATAAFGNLVVDPRWPSSTLSADGSTLAYAHLSDDSPSTVTTWRLDGSRHDFPGSAPLALSGDGKFLAVVEPGRADYVVWEVGSGRKAAMFPVWVGSEAGPMALSRDGKRMAESRQTGIGLWDVENGARLDELSDGGIGRPRFSPDGTILRTATQIWDLRQHPARPLIFGGIAGVSDDGHRVLEEGLNGVIHPVIPNAPSNNYARIVDIPSMTVRQMTRDRGLSARLSPDGRWYAKMHPIRPERSSSPLSRLYERLRAYFALPTESYRIEIREATSSRVVGSIEKPAFLGSEPSFEFSPDGATLIVHSVEPLRARGDGTTCLMRVEVWDLPTARRARTSLGLLALAAVVGGGWLDRRSARSGRAAVVA